MRHLGGSVPGKPSTVRAECKRCGKVVATRVSSYSRTVEDDDPAIPKYEEEFIFAKCSHCAGPLLLRQDDELFSQHGPLEPVLVYPEARRELDIDLLPTAVYNALTEATKCFEAGLYRAANVMCRGALECLCTHLLNQPGWRLLQSLGELHNRGIIDDRLLEWAKSLHLEGNRAAHDYEEKVTAQDAEDVLTFTQAIVDYTVVIRSRFEAYKDRLAKRTAKASKAKQVPRKT
jgi:hypothetical protein